MDSDCISYIILYIIARGAMGGQRVYLFTVSTTILVLLQEELDRVYNYCKMIYSAIGSMHDIAID